MCLFLKSLSDRISFHFLGAVRSPRRCGGGAAAAAQRRCSQQPEKRAPSATQRTLRWCYASQNTLHLSTPRKRHQAGRKSRDIYMTVLPKHRTKHVVFIPAGKTSRSTSTKFWQFWQVDIGLLRSVDFEWNLLLKALRIWDEQINWKRV